MELLFPKATIPCLRQVKHEVQTLEETQELRMPEEYPDIGKILGTWGQVLLRGKDWREGSMTVSGGVMTWILYQPEGEDAQVRTVEAWIPFQMKWDLPPTQHDGTIRVFPLLRSVDARTTSARKMVARVTVSVLGEACVQEDVQYTALPELPEDVNLLRESYPLLLPREAGEKAFDMEEELSLPGSCPKLKKIVRFSLQPELIDQKVMSGKLVFRGVAIVHLLYLSDEDQLCTWDFEVPFSRYADLDDTYEQQAQSEIVMVLTSLELQENPEGNLCLKVGLTGQYIVYDRMMVDVVRDAYSVCRKVDGKEEFLELPAVLQMENLSVTADKSVDLNGERVVDLAFYPDQPQVQRHGENLKVQLSGTFHMLTSNDRCYTGSVQRWTDTREFVAAQGVTTDAIVLPNGLPQKNSSGGALRADIRLCTVSSSAQGIPMLSALEIGEQRNPDPARPNLILRRAGSESLWQIAKTCGSTVEAIQISNHLDGEPEPERLLLIPVL